jgi:hypothetical protein
MVTVSLGEKRTHDEWSAHLMTPGRRLSEREFELLELACLHALVGDIHAALGCKQLNPNGTGGYAEQTRNLLDKLVGTVTRAAAPQRQPVQLPTPTPSHVLADGDDAEDREE